MTKRDAVVLASRALALYLICWGLNEVTILPQVVLQFRHHGAAATHDYLWNYYRVDLTFYVVRIVALFVAAEWLIKSGEGVHRYFLPGQDATPKGEPENTTAPQC
jgi:hypothetical protein